MNVVLNVILSEHFLKAVCLLICLALAFSITARAQKNRVFGKTADKVTATWQRFLRYASEATEKRLQEEERLQREQGNREKKNLFYRMDELLIRTGIRKRVPFLTVELSLVILSLFFLTVLIISTEVSGNIIVGIAAVGILYMLLLTVAKVLIRTRQKKVESSIIHFANLLENYARTSDDIVSIFHKISIYLDEPLRTAVENCYLEAYTTGNFASACNHLIISIGNPHFADMIGNIEICSRHKANYEEVIHGNKEIVRKYLSEKNVEGELVTSARSELMAMIVISVGIMYLLNDMFPGVFSGMLSGTLLGNIALAIIVFVVLYVFYVMLTLGGEEGR